jgi:tRNA (guanine-N7-)-methyltransferase
MPRRKLQRFQENADRTNIIEPGKPLYEQIKGNWHQAYFQNQYPITVELGCGRGEYTTGLAPHFPYKNFVGVDVKGDRIWKGSVVAETQQLKNVAFLRTYITQLDKFFAPGEIGEIWIPFPDPRPRDSDDKRRLTHPRFLSLYRQLLMPEGIVHFKTDDADLFEFTLGILKEQPIKDFLCTHNLYESNLMHYHFGIQTRFEQKFVQKGRTIHYLQFKFA